MKTPLFEKCMERIKRATFPQYAASLGEWYLSSDLSPTGGRESWGEVYGWCAARAHEDFIDPEIGTMLEELNADRGQLEEWQQRLVARLLLSWQHAKVLPPEFVERKMAHRAAAQANWSEAKKTNDFSRFAPYLEKTLALAREEAAFHGADPKDPDAVYGVFLRAHEPGMTTKRLREIFAVFDGFGTEVRQRIAEAPESAQSFYKGLISVPEQKGISESLVTLLPFDLTRGGLTTAPHPFTCRVGPDDVQVTTWYKADEPFASLYAVAHEAGHGMFEQGAPDWLKWALPQGMLYSLGAHESQSRFWENLVCRSKSFWKFMVERLFQEQRLHMPLSAVDVYNDVTRVRRCPIRVESDELSYNFHVLVRFEMELQLLSGTLSMQDAPKAFADLMEKHLGFRPKNDTEGILQDVHWSMGEFGYFPTYALGNFASVQLGAAIQEAIGVPEWEAALLSGNFAPIHDWLKEHVYPFGHTMTLDELMIATTGEPLDSRYWFEYIIGKYLA